MPKKYKIGKKIAGSIIDGDIIVQTPGYLQEGKINVID